MSDQPPLLFTRRLGLLAPANRAAEEAVREIEGTVRVEIKQMRGNARRMSLYWVALGIAAPMLEERLDGPLTVNMLHRIMKRRGGLAKPVTLPSGEIEWDYDSISFHKMTEIERSKFITWALETLSGWLGCDVTELRHEAERAA
jgi:hypothetical protein